MILNRLQCAGDKNQEITGLKKKKKELRKYVKNKLTGKAESSFLNLWFFGHSWGFGRTVMDSEKETS